jgi:hypothetical protein
VLPPDGSLTYVGHYRQSLLNAATITSSPSQTLMVRANYDHFYDTNPNDAVVGTSAPTVARRYTRGTSSVAANHTTVVSSAFNEARLAYLTDPGHAVGGGISPPPARAGIGAVHDRRVAAVRHHQPPVPVRRHGPCRGAQPALRRQPGSADQAASRAATLGIFTFLATTTALFAEATDRTTCRRISEPVSYGITSYELSQDVGRVLQDGSG